MTADEVEKLVKKAGWEFVRQNGSHRHFRHAERIGIVTIPMHHGDVPIGTLNHIFRQAGIEKR